MALVGVLLGVPKSIETGLVTSRWADSISGSTDLVSVDTIGAGSVDSGSDSGSSSAIPSSSWSAWASGSPGAASTTGSSPKGIATYTGAAGQVIVGRGAGFMALAGFGILLL